MFSRFSKFAVLISFSCLMSIGFALAKKSSQAQTETAKKKSPNIVMIVADDLGYSDLGAYGGEIPTPNIDSLAKGGMKMTRFYAAPTCSPTRSMLLTGVDNHQNGLGTMAEELSPRQTGKPGYEGYLNDRVVTVATVLKDSGYNTYITGKWHLGKKPDQVPAARGFKESFVLLEGAADHFNQRGYDPEAPVATYNNNGKSVELPKNFFSVDFYTNQMIQYLDRDRGDGKPFLLLVTYTAPHDPLQAPPELINKYMGKYDMGWDRLREQRFQRQKQMGIIPPNVNMIPRAAGVPAWDSLTPEERKYESKRMAIYAALVDSLDRNVGRLLNHLKQIGEYDNTLFVFISDNGAAAHDFSKGSRQEEFIKWFKKEGIDNSYQNMGNPNSFIGNAKGWAQVSASPHFGFKGRVYEGGMRIPAIFYYPPAIAAGSKSTAFGSVLDMTPTLLDFAGVKHPGTTYQGRAIFAMQGRSLRPLLEGKTNRIYGDGDPIGFELFGDGNSALFMGNWKALKVGKSLGLGDNQWHLYNITQDPTEMNDLAKQYPDKLKQMVDLYDKYEKEKGVVYFDDDPNAVIDRGL